MKRFRAHKLAALACVVGLSAHTAFAISSTPVIPPSQQMKAAEKAAKLPAAPTGEAATSKPASAPAGTPYPRDVTVKFLESCIKLNKQMIEPCKCMLKNLQKLVPYDEYTRLITQERPETDSRFMQAANACVPRE